MSRLEGNQIFEHHFSLMRILGGSFNCHLSSRFGQFLNQHPLGIQLQTQMVLSVNKLFHLGLMCIPESSLIGLENHILNILYSQDDTLILLSKHIDRHDVRRDLLIGGDLLLIGLALGGHPVQVLVHVGHVSEVDCILGRAAELDLHDQRGDGVLVLRNLLLDQEGEFLEGVGLGERVRLLDLLADELDLGVVRQVGQAVVHHLSNLLHVFQRGD